jgi:glutamyl-tRNA synthetase
LVVTGPIEAPELSEEDRAFVAQAVSALSWSPDPWHTLADTLKASTGRKGRALFHPLRLALTGRDSGPDMKTLLPLIGEAEARSRLERAAAQ